MTNLIGHVVPVVTAVALLYALAVFVTTRRVDAALPVLLDLLLVAGLLRLSETGSWAAIGSAAIIVLVRKVASYGIAAGAHARDTGHRRDPTPPPDSAPP